MAYPADEHNQSNNPSIEVTLVIHCLVVSGFVRTFKFPPAAAPASEVLLRESRRRMGLLNSGTARLLLQGAGASGNVVRFYLITRASGKTVMQKLAAIIWHMLTHRTRVPGDLNRLNQPD